MTDRISFLAKIVEAPEGGYVVTFPSVPEAITQGENLKDARKAAKDALETALDFYFEGDRAILIESSELGTFEEIFVSKKLSARINQHNDKVQKLAELRRALTNLVDSIAFHVFCTIPPGNSSVPVPGVRHCYDDAVSVLKSK